MSRSLLFTVVALLCLAPGCRGKKGPVAPAADSKQPSPAVSDSDGKGAPSTAAKGANSPAAGPTLTLEKIPADAGVVNLIEKVRLADHVLKGNVRFSEDRAALMLEQPQQVSQVIIPVEPPSHYEMQCELTLLNGTETFFWGIVAGGQQGMLSLDGFPKYGYNTGVGMIGDRRPAHDDFWPRVRGRLLTRKQPVQLNCLATPDDICILFDGRRLLHLGAESVHQLRVPDFYALPSDRCLFLGSWNAQFQVANLQLTTLSKAEVQSRLDEMLFGEKLRTALLINPADQAHANQFRTEIKAAIPDYRRLERQDAKTKGEREALAPRLHLPDQLEKRRWLARHEAVDLVLVNRPVRGKSPYTNVLVFGPRAVLAADIAIPYQGNLTVEQDLINQAVSAAKKKVESDAPLLLFGDWQAAEGAGGLWTAAAQRLTGVVANASPHCQFQSTMSAAEAKDQFAGWPLWTIHGAAASAENGVQLTITLNTGERQLVRQWQAPPSGTPDGAELAVVVRQLLAEAAGADAPAEAESRELLSSRLLEDRSPLGLWAAGAAARRMNAGDLLAAADCFAAAAMMEPDREVHHAKAAWCCALVEGEPAARLDAYLRGLRHLDLAEAAAPQPQSLRREGAMPTDIRKQLLEMGLRALSEVDPARRQAALPEQTRLLVDLLGRRLEKNAPPIQPYLDQLHATVPVERRVELLEPAVAAHQGRPDYPLLVKLLSPLDQADELVKRTWTSRDGRKAELTFVRRTPGGVQLRTAAGKDVQVPWENLSAADQQWVQQQGAAP